MAKKVAHETDKTFTMCGALDYLAPEVINESGHSMAADWWSYGALLYEMFYGKPPFYSRIRKEVADKITN